MGEAVGGSERASERETPCLNRYIPGTLKVLKLQTDLPQDRKYLQLGKILDRCLFRVRDAFDHHDYRHSALYGRFKRDDGFLSFKGFFRVQVTDDEMVMLLCVG